ncbi:Zn(2)-C6 fungal-type domain-containing protein [Trichoderma simmonsii]|uniref:Zn(2)-C6 fungal-type domain-containing protein n=1 Tax=Trichoderma simmonsii TaxID=1491479 RepID=A0A8G0LQ30_9HYPO|nr:Zn(2)-C6 fungal-type domain-containing protein [Trichoderma simmonsii]
MEKAAGSPFTRGGVEVEPRRRTGHLRRSCETCRRSKVRCIPKADSSNAFPLCERCSVNGTACIFERAIARPRQTKSMPKSKRKVVEEKIDGLVTLISSISAKSAAREVPSPTNVDSTTPLVASSSPECTTLSPTTRQDVVAKGFLTTDEAKQLLADFAAASGEFSPVLVPPEASLDYLRLERPCLLLAILAACARDHLQARLEIEFRKMLADRVIVNAEKNLDLLQGLLVYLTWNHLYFNPAKEQIYQLSQMATTMAAELKLPPDDSIKDILIQQRGTFDKNGQYYFIIEKMRTFVACYYVDSCISLAMRKPTHFKYCKTVADCCILLPYVSLTASDEILSCFVQLQGLAEEIDQLFQYNNIRWLEVVDHVQIQVMMNKFKEKLDELVKSFPPEAKVNSLIQRKCLYIQIYIQEVGLHSPPHHEVNLDFTTMCCSWCSSLPRLNIAISCIRAAQNYINEYVFLSPQSLRFTVLFQESELLYAILVLAAATLGGVTVSEPGQLRELADISPYLIALRDKMLTMGTMSDHGQDRRDYFWKMTQFFKHCLNWKSQESGNQDPCLGTCSSSSDDSMSFLRILENIPTEEVIQKDTMLNLLDMSWIMIASEF